MVLFDPHSIGHFKIYVCLLCVGEENIPQVSMKNQKKQ